MRDGGGEDGVETTRRGLLAAVAGGSLAGFAGCASGPNEVTSTSEYLGHSFPQLIEDAQLNPWTGNYPSEFVPAIFEYLSLRTPGEGWRPARVLESVDVEESAVTVRFADDYTWWNGEPVTARDKWVKDRINELRPDRRRSSFALPDRPPVALVDDYTLRYDLDEPLARPLVFSRLLNELVATPAWLFESWLERFEDAATESEREAVNDDLQSTTFGLEEAAERGFGCGPYEFEEVSINRLILRQFEDHPLADDLSIPRLWLPPEQGDRIEGLIKQGWLDADRGVLADRGIEIPDNLEQLATYPTNDGWKLALNWQNDHLARPNVRRALLSALPLPTIVNSTDWGLPTEIQTGLTLPAQRRWLDDDLLDSLYRYPVEADHERAAAFMRDAGYERRRGDQWYSPDGIRVALDLLVPVGSTSGANLVEQALDSFGFVVNVNQISVTSYFVAAERQDYDLLLWGTGGTPYAVYDVTTSTASTLAYGVMDPKVEFSPTGRPVSVSIPDDPADFDGEAGRSIDLLEQWNRIRSPTSERETREAISLFARWWNYALPDIDVATHVQGVWGNTQDFEWPDGDDEAYRTYGPQNRPEYFMVKTGQVRQSSESG